jgi:hypothetical protein
MAEVNKNNSKMTFSGHESFQCRQLWLKKGFDFVSNGRSFNSEDAVVELGVGKNMVGAIRFWMKAFGLLATGDKLTPLASRLLADDGWDPYLEDDGSLWLLHYQLVKNSYASTYSIVFNELRRERMEFTKDNFISIVKRKVEAEKFFPFSDRTLAEDFSVLTKMYLRSDSGKEKEDSFSGLLSELNLVKSFRKSKDEYLVIENVDRQEVPAEIVLYAILDNEDFEKSVNLNSIEKNYNSVGSVFAMNRTCIVQKIESLLPKHSNIVFHDHAGIKEIQFKNKPSAFSILNRYYAN